MIDHDGLEWLTYADASERLNVKEATIRKWVQRGKATSHQIGRVAYVRICDLAGAEHKTRGQYLALRR